MKTKNNDRPQESKDVLVSDLDGTLIPLPDSAQNKKDLVQLSKLREIHDFTVVFATGRSFRSVLDAIEQHKLPAPDWIICNVGTTVYKKCDDSFSELSAYREELNRICDGIDHNRIEAALKHLKNLRLQPKANQSDFKISYWCEEHELHDLIDQVDEIQQRESLPYSCLGSVDPFSKRGLVDILPKGVDKGYALSWLSKWQEWAPDRIVYAGDSGNDLAAFIGEYASVVVGNATDRLRSEVKGLLKEKEGAGPCYFAKGLATSGVLEGMEYYKLAH